MINEPSLICSETYFNKAGLLLEQVKKEEVDIHQINLSGITSAYLEQLKKRASFDLEQAGDFVRWASFLLLIKSRSLLPALEIEKEEEEEEEDAAELQERLLKLMGECQRYKAAGKIIYNRKLLGRDSWSAGQTFVSDTDSSKEEMVIKEEEAPFLLIQSYKKAISKINKIRSPVPLSPLPSLTARIKELSAFLVAGAKNAFSSLVSLNRKDHSLLLTFLSLLELSRMGFVSLFQRSLFSDIDVLTEKQIDAAAFENLDKKTGDDFSRGVRERAAV